MNKRNKIIVSIVGITIVLLALLGITYAYYLTRIEGNTNTNSISITTANLKLSYGDGNEIITASNIMPGSTIGEKTFTVTNSGNTTIENYKVVLEYAVIEDVNPVRFIRPQDFEITVSCESKDVETDEISGTCNGYIGNFNNESFEITSNTIDEGIRHEYSLTIYYANPDVDQSDDMGKNLNLKVQIYGATDTSILNGTITGVESTYTMELHSKAKASVLIPTKNSGEYSYKFIGVEPGEHTLYVIDASGNEVSSETITINKGTNTNVSGNIITVKDNQSNIYITSSNSDGTLSSSARFNPYSDNTNSLAYHIINNSMNHTNGTFLLDNPPSRVAEEISLTEWELGIETPIYIDDFKNELFTDSEFYIADNDENYSRCVDGFLNEETGEYESDCSSVISYTQCTNDDIGKIVFYYSGTEENLEVVRHEIIGCKNNKIVIDNNKTENILSSTQDDYGTSYYFRGNVLDNYLSFAGMCWRIVRIQGDGSVKLILEDQDEVCGSTMNGNWAIPIATGDSTYIGNFGYNTYYNDELVASDGTKNQNTIKLIDYLHGEVYSDKSMATAFKNFEDLFNASQLSKLKTGDWCLNDLGYDNSGNKLNSAQLYDSKVKSNSYFYDSYARLTNELFSGYRPTLKCNGTILNNWGDENSSPMYVGAITADEVVYAGGKYDEYNQKYYLINNEFINVASPGNKMSYFWTLSPFGSGREHPYEEVFIVSNQGVLTSHEVERNFTLRPVISLLPGSIISSGDGTQNNPYVIN